MAKKGVKRNTTRKSVRSLDFSQVEKLGMLMCTLNECSAFLDIPSSTLNKNKLFMDAWTRGKEKGKMSLRRSQFSLAEKNAAMAIWLGKQYLNQKDKQELEHSGKINGAVQIIQLPDNARD